MRIAYVISSGEGKGAAAVVPAVTRVLRAAGAEVVVFALARCDGPSCIGGGTAAARASPAQRAHEAAPRDFLRHTRPARLNFPGKRTS